MSNLTLATVVLSGNFADQKNPQNADKQQNSVQERNAAERNKQNQDKADNAQALRSDKQQDKSQEQGKSAQQAVTDDKLTPEQQMQQRATEQWLRQIPDDPSGLLRRKFIYEHQQREQKSQDDGKPLW